ncbi:basic salivary proline-rich protein 4-like [Sarcophilus harrisii]|uniref:basic salivary proline-rich protein 4-like n=1 Tax=Sarcophilus harrisii TaxID=9305 RepID=UPI0013020905|nr:basic salivary proline-rich protein 4-like [Sarcophilus harrisii]
MAWPGRGLPDPGGRQPPTAGRRTLGPRASGAGAREGGRRLPGQRPRGRRAGVLAMAPPARCAPRFPGGSGSARGSAAEPQQAPELSARPPSCSARDAQLSPSLSPGSSDAGTWTPRAGRGRGSQSSGLPIGRAARPSRQAPPPCRHPRRTGEIIKCPELCGAAARARGPPVLSGRPRLPEAPRGSPGAPDGRSGSLSRGRLQAPDPGATGRLAPCRPPASSAPRWTPPAPRGESCPSWSLPGGQGWGAFEEPGPCTCRRGRSPPGKPLEPRKGAEPGPGRSESPPRSPEDRGPWRSSSPTPGFIESGKLRHRAGKASAQSHAANG